MPRISIDKIKEISFKLTKERSRSYPGQIITDADYADDIALLSNAPDQAETLLHSLERATAGIDLHVNAHKMEYMSFNQRGDISTLNGSSLKVVYKFIYPGRSVSSTETDIDTQLAKAWTAIDWQSVIWKSDLTDKIKHSFFQAVIVSILLYGALHGLQLNVWRNSLTATTQECCEQYWTSHGGRNPQNSSCTVTYYLSRKFSKLDEPDMRDTSGEVGTSS